jgi:hypothetical protein
VSAVYLRSRLCRSGDGGDERKQKTGSGRQEAGERGEGVARHVD